MSRSIRRALAWTVSRNAGSGVSPWRSASWNASRYPRMFVRGVRSSWEALETKSLLICESLRSSVMSRSVMSTSAPVSPAVPDHGAGEPDRPVPFARREPRCPAASVPLPLQPPVDERRGSAGGGSPRRRGGLPPSSPRRRGPFPPRGSSSARSGPGRRRSRRRRGWRAASSGASSPRRAAGSFPRAATPCGSWRSPRPRARRPSGLRTVRDRFPEPISRAAAFISASGPGDPSGQQGGPAQDEQQRRERRSPDDGHDLPEASFAGWKRGSPSGRRR